MTPAARIASAIELLGRIDALARPADQVVGEFVRARRFMGAKDRRAVTDLVFQVLRARARLEWWAAVASGRDAAAAERMAEARAAGPRTLLQAGLVLIDGWTPDAVAALFDGRQYHPEPLTPEERACVDALADQHLTQEGQPAWVRLEVPRWLLPAFERAFGERAEAELAGLGAEAPVDLRVNTLRADGRDGAAAVLREEGLETDPTPYSPLGLRLRGRRAVTATRAYREGLVEVQDEGSQLVALLAGARPDMAVCDFCAGAGGKTLALAAAMDDRGRLAALDVDRERLGRAGPRLRRAGARNVERRLLAGEGDPWFPAQAGRFDRVLVDAPCSGVGAWRRQPDARWRLGEADLRRHADEQARILRRAAGLVRPGGRLIYATCSLLAVENHERIHDFLREERLFEPLAAAQAWAEAIGGTCPADDGGDLMLTPGRHGTDGFYVAVLQRRRQE